MSDPIFIRLCRKCASATSWQRGRPRGYMLLEEPESGKELTCPMCYRPAMVYRYEFVARPPQQAPKTGGGERARSG